MNAIEEERSVGSAVARRSRVLAPRCGAGWRSRPLRARRAPRAMTSRRRRSTASRCWTSATTSTDRSGLVRHACASTKLPSFEDEFGHDNSTFSGVRQSRLGVKPSTPTDLGDLKTTFEFELFGTGVDAGQTTFRLRHAYGELGQFGAGQTWSPFMDPDVFPNSLEYWGPTGMVFFRNVQVRWMPIERRHAVHRGARASGRQRRRGRVRRPHRAAEHQAALPDARLLRRVQADGRSGATSSVAGMLRVHQVGRHRSTISSICPASATGWGMNLELEREARQARRSLQARRIGEGIQNYMNDSPVDIGIENNSGNPVTPVTGEPMPIVGVVAFLDHTWNDGSRSRWATRCRTSTTPTARRPTRSSVGHYCAGQCALHARAERHGRRRVPVGPPRELLGWIPQRRRSSCSSPSNTTSRTRSEVSNDHESTALVVDPGVLRLAVVAAATAPLNAQARPAGEHRRRRSTRRTRNSRPAGRQERRLHPGAGQGRSEPVRHRRWSPSTARSTPPATSRPKCRSSRFPRSSRWRR